MEFRQLRYFLAVAEELSFTRAARRVGIAQPPLSAQIRALEEELGAALFQRTQRSVTLTPAGVALVRHARRIMNETQRAATEIRAIHEGRQGVIAVGAVYATIYGLLPRAIRALAGSHPGVTVRVEEMTVAQQVQALHDGTIDLGILRGAVSDPEIEARPIQDEPFLVAIPADHPWAARATIASADLGGMPFIAVSGRGSDYASRVGDFFLSLGAAPRVVQTVVDMHTLVGLVGAGLGIALVPTSVAALRPSPVVFRPLSGEAPHITTSVAWHRDNFSPIRPVMLAAIEAAARAQLA